MKIIKKTPKKLYRKFQMELPEHIREEIDEMIRDHIMCHSDIWDNKHFCNAYWNITLHLQPWED